MKSLAIFLSIALGCYLGGYATMRVSGVLVRIENRSDPPRSHEVRSSNRDAWSEMAFEMAEETGGGVTFLSRWRQATLEGVDLLFRPLGRLESFVRRTVPGSG